MLRVTIEILPGGRESGRRTLAVAEIGNAGGGALATYNVVVTEAGTPLRAQATLKGYPRWSASIWDLVLRAVSKALTGQERLPRRPHPLEVPIRTCGTTRYVRFSDIPEPARSTFERRMLGATCPVIEEDPAPRDCVYASDWQDFLAGGR